MWQYIKENKLQDPQNKQFVNCDEKLSKVNAKILWFYLFYNYLIFQVIPDKKFRGFGMAKYLKDHMNVDWKEEEDNKMQKLFNL